MTHASTTSKPVISYEFFPPKTEAGMEKLFKTLPRYEAAKAEYISVTYGAGGSTQKATYTLIKHIKEHSKLAPAAHLTCVGATKETIDNIAKGYLEIGVNRIVALRGDMPGMTGKYVPHPEGYAYADNLVAGLKDIADFDISVAAYPETHPQALSPQADIEHLKRKQDAGANRAITQYCFETDTILQFIDQAQKSGIDFPIVPGIMMIGNFSQLVNFSKRCGASIPDWLHGYYDESLSEEEQYKNSVEIALKQCETLIANGIRQFHFYTLNQPDVALEVAHRLGAF